MSMPEPNQLAPGGQAQFNWDRLLAASLAVVFLVEILGNFNTLSFYSQRLLPVLVLLAIFAAFVFARQSFLTFLATALVLLLFALLSWLSALESFPERRFLQVLASRAKFDRRMKAEIIRDTFYFHVTSSVERSGLFRLRFRARLRDEEGSEFGDVLIDAPDVPWSELSEINQGAKGRAVFRLKLLTSDPDVLPAPFSYEAYLYRRGFVASGRLEELADISHNPPESLWRRFVSRLTLQITPSAELAIVLASTVGEDDLLDQHTKDLFRSTGLTHVLVVSGYQVGVVFLLFFSLFRFIFKRSISFVSRFALDGGAAISALVAAYGYAMLTGGPVTAERAIWALALLALGRTVGRKLHLWRSYGAVLLCSMLVWPAAIFEAGFELMFFALLGLMAARPFAEYLVAHRKWKKNLAELVSMSLLPTIFTTPIVILWFQLFVPAAAIFNFLFAFLMSVICTSFSGLALLCVFLQLPGAYSLLRCGMFLTKQLISCLEYLESLLRGLGIQAYVLEGTELGLAIALSTTLALLTAFLTLVLPHVSIRNGRDLKREDGEEKAEQLGSLAPTLSRSEEKNLPKVERYGRTARNSPKQIRV